MPGAVRGGHDAILEMLNLHDRSMEQLGAGAGAQSGNDSTAGARGAAAGANPAGSPDPGRPRAAPADTSAPDEL